MTASISLLTVRVTIMCMASRVMTPMSAMMSVIMLQMKRSEGGTWTRLYLRDLVLDVRGVSVEEGLL